MKGMVITMLNIFICEDRPDQRALIERLVNKVVIEENFDVGFAVSVDNPPALLSYLENNPIRNALYFLDVDLQHEMTGIELGAKIREFDTSATIVFITTHSEMAHLVFEYKVEAMEYIIKGDTDKLEVGIRECIQLAYQRYLSGKRTERKHFVVNTGGGVWNIPYDEILYFETNAHTNNKLILHTKTGEIDFRSTLSDVTHSAPEFYLCHKSFVVNPKSIKHVHKANRKLWIELVNDEIIPVTAKRLPGLLEVIR